MIISNSIEMFGIEIYSDDIDRLFGNTIIRNGCEEWLGKPGAFGYGNIKIGSRSKIRKNIKVHRLAYFIYYGEFDISLDILHTCDNRICIMRKHLFKGTAVDNMRDMVMKGRHNNPKLKYDDISLIKDMFFIEGISQYKIAEIFSVSQSLIFKIVNNKAWSY